MRDTGIGMTEKEIATALEPFRQLATSTRWGSGGTGLGLPLTKALAEANRAAFHDQERAECRHAGGDHVSGGRGCSPADGGFQLRRPAAAPRSNRFFDPRS